MARRLTKPASIRSDPWRSRKWNEIVRGRDLSPSDAPTIALLVSWYQVIEQCMDDIGASGGVQVAYQNDVGDIKALPKLSTSLLTSQIGTAPKLSPLYESRTTVCLPVRLALLQNICVGQASRVGTQSSAPCA